MPQNLCSIDLEKFKNISYKYFNKICWNVKIETLFWFLRHLTRFSFHTFYWRSIFSRKIASFLIFSVVKPIFHRITSHYLKNQKFQQNLCITKICQFMRISSKISFQLINFCGKILNFIKFSQIWNHVSLLNPNIEFTFWIMMFPKI